MMNSLEASEPKARCGEVINSLAFPVYVRIWIPSTKGSSSAQAGCEQQHRGCRLCFLCACNFTKLDIARSLGFFNNMKFYDVSRVT